MCGDIETCPGPAPLEDITTMRGIKIVHQSIARQLWNLCATLGKNKNIDIMTLSETHIAQNDREEITNLFNISGYTVVFKRWFGKGE